MSGWTLSLFDADVLCLTSISRDHTEFLGKYLRQIIKEACSFKKRYCSSILSPYSLLKKTWSKNIALIFVLRCFY